MTPVETASPWRGTADADVLAGTGPTTVGASRAPHLVARARRRLASHRPVELLPGWPLVLLFVGYPLWWIGGVAVFAPLVAAVPMLGYLLALRHIRLPSGFALWLLFLAWATAGVTVLWVQPSGTLAVAGLDRLVPFGYRLAWYAAVTVVLLYVGNLRRSQLSDQRVYRLLAWMFLVTVVGGYIGYLAPNVPVRSVLEIVLPAGVRSNDFLSVLIHPNLAQLQDIGIEVTRSSAPFVYANDWGANYGLLAPFFVLAWTGAHAGWRRRVFPFVALVSVPPVIFSLNRGLWLGLVVVAIFVAVRLALMGRLAAMSGVLGAAVLTGALLGATPLGDLVTERFENQHSNEGRTELANRAVAIAWEESPILGFGGSREVAGNFYSIAGASSEACPGCSPPQIGTQGHLWLLVFGHGLVGAAWFFGFLGRRLVVGLRGTSRDATALCAVVVFYVTVMFAYDLLTLPTFVLMIALGLLWRHESEPAVVRFTDRRSALDEPSHGTTVPSASTPR